MDSFADIFQCPGNVSDYMKFIDNNGSTRKIFRCQIAVNFVHICNEIPNFLFIRKFIEILHQGNPRPRRENVKQSMDFASVRIA